MNAPQSLIDKLANGKVIPFAGAGVSMAILRKDNGERLFPSWKDLLFLSAEQLEKEGKNKDATYIRSALNLDEPDFLSIAAHAKKQLGPVWAPFLKNIFNPPRNTIHEDSLVLPQLIWNLGSKLIITSNYDKILRWSCPNTDDCETWNIEHKAEKADFSGKPADKKTDGLAPAWLHRRCVQNHSRQ